jgi:hypothetical protein
MIHFLQCLWWEWRWRRLGERRKNLFIAAFMSDSPDEKERLDDEADRLVYEMARLEALMSGGGR